MTSPHAASTAATATTTLASAGSNYCRQWAEDVTTLAFFFLSPPKSSHFEQDLEPTSYTNFIITMLY